MILKPPREDQMPKTNTKQQEDKGLSRTFMDPKTDPDMVKKGPERSPKG